MANTKSLWLRLALSISQGIGDVAAEYKKEETDEAERTLL